MDPGERRGGPMGGPHVTFGETSKVLNVGRKIPKNPLVGGRPLESHFWERAHL